MLNRFSQTASKSTAASFIRLSSARTVSNPCQSASSTPTRNLTTSRDISFKPGSISTRSYATQSDTLPSNMSIEESMRTKLQKELDPIKLNIRNDSSKHSHHAAMVAQGGGSGETHFFIEIISNSFKGKPQLARHRLINGILKEEFDNGLHALSLRLKTEEEEAKGMKA